MITIEAYPDCNVCHGSGQMVDSVPYGSTYVSMYTPCEACIERAEADGLFVDDGDSDVEVVPARGVVTR